jgi:hypothetical protein
MGRDWTEPVMLLANAVDSADLSLLPGIFRVLEADYGASPTQLSGLVLSQAALKGLAYPVWGYLADRRPRKPLLATAAAAWAAAALLVATASSVAAMAALLGAGGVARGAGLPHAAQPVDPLRSLPTGAPRRRVRPDVRGRRQCARPWELPGAAPSCARTSVGPWLTRVVPLRSWRDAGLGAVHGPLRRAALRR